MCMHLTGLEVVITSRGGNGEKQFDLMFLGKTSSWMSLPPWLDASHVVRMAPANAGWGGTCTLKGQLLLGGLLRTLGKHFQHL